MLRLRTLFRAAPVYIMLLLLQPLALMAADSGYSRLKTETWFAANANGNAGGSMIEVSIRVDGAAFTAKLYDTDAPRALLTQLPLTLQMHELNGNEKYCYLAFNLPVSSERVAHVQAGDLMLFGSDCLVLFYEGFATSYSYTRLGHIENASGLAAALGTGDTEIGFSTD